MLRQSGEGGNPDSHLASVVVVGMGHGVSVGLGQSRQRCCLGPLHLTWSLASVCLHLWEFELVASPAPSLEYRRRMETQDLIAVLFLGARSLPSLPASPHRSESSVCFICSVQCPWF